MDFDLQQRLHDLNRAQVVAPDPVPVGQVLTRVHRRRTIRTAAVGLASAAVIVAAAAVVYAAPWENPPPPAETPTPTTTSAPTPTPPTGPLFDATTMDNLFLTVEELTGVAPALGDLGRTWALGEWTDIPDGAELLPDARCKPANTMVNEAPAEYAHRGQGAFSQEIVLLADSVAAAEAFIDLTDALETCGGWGVELEDLTHGAWWAIDETRRGAEGFGSIRVTGVMQGEGQETPWIEVNALIGNAILRIGAVYSDASPVSATADVAALEAAVQNHLSTVAAGPLVPRVDPPIVALTTTGDLVLLSPETGETLEVITSDPALRGPISLAADRSAAFLGRGGPPYEVVRVSLTDGSITPIADGLSPSLSPDGQTLAYVAPYNINHPDDSEWRSLALLDLATGDVQYLPDNSCGGCARRIDQPAWSPDGSRLYIAVGFEDSALPSMDLVVVIPGTTTDLDTAPVFQPNDTYTHGIPGFPAFLTDGTLAVASVIYVGSGDAADGLTSHLGTIETFEASSATTLDNGQQLPELHSIDRDDEVLTHTRGVASRPWANGLAIVAEDWSDPAGLQHDVYIWEGGDQLRWLADGIIAVAW